MVFTTTRACRWAAASRATSSSVGCGSGHHVYLTRRSAAYRGFGSAITSLGSMSFIVVKSHSSGWVAEERSTVVLKRWAKARSASAITGSSWCGSAWTSSRTSTAFASRWTFRIWAGRRPNSDSNSCTGGDDERGVPIFCSEPVPSPFRAVTVHLYVGVVFQYDGLFVGAGWVEQSAEYGRVLLGDGQERDGDDDPAAAVECRVAQGECRRGQRLARSGGRRQAVDSGGSFGGGDGRLVHLFPPPVYRGGRALCDQLGATSGEPVPQLRKVRGRRDAGSLESPAVRRGVEAVRVDQAGVEEADQELTVELVIEADRERYRGRVEQFRQQRPQGVLGAGTTQQPVLGLLLQQRLAHSA